MRQIKTAVVGILALFAALPAAAQTFPTVPANTVIGRLGIGPGPAQAIPNSTLFSLSLFDLISTTQGVIPCRGPTVWGPISPGAAGGVFMSTGTSTCPAFSVPVPVASGGTGGITAPAARVGLNVDQYTPHNDSDYVILSTDRSVGTSATLTAARTWTLPAANAVNAGQTLTVMDTFGGVSGSNTLTIQRAGSDTIGGATSVTISAAYGRYDFRSDGVSKWSAAATSSSSSGPKTPLDYGALCNGSTDDATALQAWLDALPTAGPGSIPPNKVCIHTGQLYVSSNTVIDGNHSTIKAANSSGSSTTGIHMTDATWAGTGPSNVTIKNLIYDGNRANRTPPGQASGIYIINASNIRLQNVKAMNCVADCIYAGQAAAGASSTNITWDGVITVNAYRNGGTIAGVQQMSVIGSSFSGTNGTSPQSGLDVEPDNAGAGLNSGVYISNSSFDGNAGNGMNAHCVIAAQCNLRSGGNNLTASSNGGYGFFAAATSTNFRWCNINGVGNSSGASSGVTDKCPP